MLNKQKTSIFLIKKIKWEISPKQNKRSLKKKSITTTATTATTATTTKRWPRRSQNENTNMKIYFNQIYQV